MKEVVANPFTTTSCRSSTVLILHQDNNIQYKLFDSVPRCIRTVCHSILRMHLEKLSVIAERMEAERDKISST